MLGVLFGCCGFFVLQGVKFVNVQENNIPFMETSAKSGTNVSVVFFDVAK